MKELSNTIYCSKDQCNNEADQVMITDDGNYPFCNWCIEITNYMCILAGCDFDAWLMPLDDYRSEREAMYENPEEEERGQFLYSYVEGDSNE